MNKINPIIQWWMGQNFPREHIFISRDKRPKGFYNFLRVYFRKWIVHPARRRVAKYYLMLLKKLFGIKVIALTGSAGKTTTKEMIKAVLSRKGSTIASYKNIDPVYNIPMTILKCGPGTKYLVLEFGVEYPGEMDFYLWLAKPDLGIFLNIYPTHTEFFGDEKGIYKEKVKLITSLSSSGIAVLNREDKRVFESAKLVQGEVVWFGKKAKISAKNSKIIEGMSTKYILEINKSKISVRLKIPGEHFVLNSLAAAACASALGFSLNDIKSGLENYEEPEHRMNVFRLGNGALIIDDSYNNNPSAARKTLKTFTEIADNRKKIIVFGDMLELGTLEEREHEKIGEIVSKMDVAYFIGVGKASIRSVAKVKENQGEKRASWVESEKKVLSKLRPFLKKDSAILIKGSRSIGLDNLVHKLYEYT